MSEKVLSMQVGRGENFSDYWLKEPATAPTSMVARLEVFSHATPQDTRLTLQLLDIHCKHEVSMS